MSRLFLECLKFFGLALNSELIEARQEAAKYLAYAAEVTSHAKDRGDIVIGGDYTALDNALINTRVIVPPGVKHTSIRNLRVRPPADSATGAP